MPKITDATALTVGSRMAERAYLGEQLVWQRPILGTRVLRKGQGLWQSPPPWGAFFPGCVLAGWFKLEPGYEQSGTMMCVGSSDIAGHYITLGLTPGSQAFAEMQGSGGYFIGSNQAGAAIKGGEWHHFAAKYGHDVGVGGAAGGYITVYVDGVPGPPLFVFNAGQPENLDLVMICGEWGHHRGDATQLLGVSTGNHHPGSYSHWGMWDSPLTDAEIAQLAAGASPASIGFVVGWWPLHGTAIPEAGNGAGPLNPLPSVGFTSLRNAQDHPLARD